MLESPDIKETGAYYTPDEVVFSLVRWVVRSPKDRMLDPSCGDGRFLALHPNSLGIEQDQLACAFVHEHYPGRLIHEGDFFAWASETEERFDCAVGNPPFIRYHRFSGPTRHQALELCKRHGVTLSGLASSWAPFLVASASLLKTGGRMAFVVPSEVGHANYAAPLIAFFARNFASTHIIAIRRKLFPLLSEDCWLLYAEGFGGSSNSIGFSAIDTFQCSTVPPSPNAQVDLVELKRWNYRLRPFLLPKAVRDLFVQSPTEAAVVRLGSLARVNIGYVTGANRFFHLRPSLARDLQIPESFLYPSVRRSASLEETVLRPSTVDEWLACDQDILLLRLPRDQVVPEPVQRYLDTEEGKTARTAYKCRSREPWYWVPDVFVPDAFITNMSGGSPRMCYNAAKCIGSNSVLTVKFGSPELAQRVCQQFSDPFTQVSCELEGHPLGGGMLKIEPREASRLSFLRPNQEHLVNNDTLGGALETLRAWRHCGKANTGM